MTVRLALAGDVMTGRGVDQVLGHPGDPTLYERWVEDARRYVELAEQASGPVPRRVDDAWIWGDLLDDLAEADVRVANLETAVTDRGRPWPRKGIHYRMHPANASCLRVPGFDVLTLANNHALDWSRPGLEQTLEVVQGLGIAVVGAGPDRDAAEAPAVVEAAGRRVVVAGVGAVSSGIPPAWAAGRDTPGLAVVDLHDRAAASRLVASLADRVQQVARAGDVVVASIHWGGNWGWPIPGRHRWLARALVDDAGVGVVHGHSSHHPLAIEVHDGHPVLYGCGDLVTDYEGIRGHEQYRGDLGGLYLLDLDRAGRLERLVLEPSRMQRFRLTRPSAEDRAWLAATLRRASAPFGVDWVERDGRLELRW